ncbi:MAG: tRNA uridine(34) 5-carboxymethylaminomethyl modification radical SAM/GNAT enzyme Elp3 [Candidatus Aenigmatarchaeota archaeon]|nr:tRNA uridine(34) 5-carboxymethylaminomethyl modification radical SAM/GNAT enzyme Elp3 [Candidatus Aenigmarchaeota archaeon]
MKKIIRTISGVTPISVMLKPFPCPHGKCIYCPSQENVPESYTKTSPVVLRAKDCNWDAEKQVLSRLKILKLMGHVTNKIELIVMGGTFSAYPKEYREEFIKKCFDGLNGIKSNSLEEAKKINETANHRCVALCLETRPDFCSPEDIESFLYYGATRIEIGVQSPDNESYKITNRGHTLEDVILATKNLKEAGFKLGYHLMLGLPGASLEEDFQKIKMLFEDERFRPDQIKLYPTFVIKGTKLEEMYNKNEYKPYTTEEIVKLLAKIKSIVPEYVRIMRIMRDIPAEYIISECKYSHLRDELKKYMKENNMKCNCIRCREIGHVLHSGGNVNLNEIKMKRINYNASGGKEIFLSFETSNALFSLLRLRINQNGKAIIRELHTYGPELEIGKQPTNIHFQHRGLGKKLVKEAERITKEDYGINKIYVIAGVGVRQYFYKLGYELDGYYVSKKL